MKAKEIGQNYPQDNQFYPGSDYQHQLKQTYSSTLVSNKISNVISGYTAAIQNYFVDKFPDGFFNDSYINTQINQNKFNVPYAKAKMPFLATSVRFENQLSEMGNIWRQYSAGESVRNYNKDEYYTPIMKDPYKRLNMWTVDNRIKLTIDFAIRVQSEMQAWNVANLITQKIEPEGAIFLNLQSISTPVPTDIILNIADELGYTVNDPHDTEKNTQGRAQLREFLVQSSENPILEIINSQTGNPSYNYNYITNILLRFPNLAESERTMSGVVVKDGTVRFSIEAEGWYPASFVYESKANYKSYTKDDSIENANTSTISMMVMQNLIPNQLQNGMRRSESNTIQYSPDFNTSVDTADLNDLLGNGLQTIINNQHKYGYDLSKLFTFIMFKNNKMIDNSDKVYSIDYENRILTFNKPERNVSYTFALYTDRIKVTNLLSFLKNKETSKIFDMDIFTVSKENQH